MQVWYHIRRYYQFIRTFCCVNIDCPVRTTPDVTHFSLIYAFSRRFYPKRLTLHSSYSFYILSALAFPGNRTHDFGVASTMLYQLSYRKAVVILIQFSVVITHSKLVFHYYSKLLQFWTLHRYVDHKLHYVLQVISTVIFFTKQSLDNSEHSHFDNFSYFFPLLCTQRVIFEDMCCHSNTLL